MKVTFSTDKKGSYKNLLQLTQYLVMKRMILNDENLNPMIGYNEVRSALLYNIVLEGPNQCSEERKKKRMQIGNKEAVFIRQNQYIQGKS